MGLNLYESLPYNITTSDRVVTGRGRLTGLVLTSGAGAAEIEIWDFGNKKLMPLFKATASTTGGIQFTSPIQVKNGVSANIAGANASAAIYFVSSPA